MSAWWEGSAYLWKLCAVEGPALDVYLEVVAGEKSLDFLPQSAALVTWTLGKTFDLD